MSPGNRVKITIFDLQVRDEGLKPRGQVRDEYEVRGFACGLKTWTHVELGRSGQTYCDADSL